MKFHTILSAITSCTLLSNPAIAWVTPVKERVGITASILEQGKYGQGTTIAVVDTGLDVTDPQFAGHTTQSCFFYTPSYCDMDDTNIRNIGKTHGALVAAVAAGNQSGIAPQADLAAMKVFYTDGKVAGNISAAILRAADMKAAAINLSFTNSLYFNDAFNYAAARGSTIVVGGGNANNTAYPEVTNFPLDAYALKHLLFVGAVDKNNQIEPYSTIPGNGYVGNFYSTTPGAKVPIASLWLVGTSDTGTDYHAPTSFVTPQVSGAISLLTARWPVLFRNGTTAELLLRTATDLGAPGVDGIYGAGLLNVEKAFQPVGALYGKTLSGESVMLTQAPFSTNGTVYLDALSHELSQMTGFDSYDRDFTVSLRIAPPRRPSFFRPSIRPVFTQSGVTTYASGSRLQFVGSRSHDLLNAQDVRNDYYVSFTDHTGHTLATGSGFPASVAFADAMWGSGTTLSQAALGLNASNAVMDLAQGGYFTATGVPLNADTRLAFSWSQTQQADIAHNSLAPDAVALSAALTHRLNDDWSMGFTTNLLEESNGLLGNIYDSRSPVSLGDSNRTLSLGIQSIHELGEDESVAFNAALARTDGAHTNGLIANVSPLFAASYGAAYTHQNMWQKGDALSLSLNAPMRVYSGTAQLAHTTVDAQGYAFTTARDIDLSGGVGEMHLAFSYAMPVEIMDQAQWNTTANFRHNAYNQPADVAELLTELKFRF